MGIPRIHAPLLTLPLVLFLTSSSAPGAASDEATLTTLFTEGSCSVGGATTCEESTMADNTGL